MLCLYGSPLMLCHEGIYYFDNSAEAIFSIDMLIHYKGLRLAVARKPGLLKYM